MGGDKGTERDAEQGCKTNGKGITPPSHTWESRAGKAGKAISDKVPANEPEMQAQPLHPLFITWFYEKSRTKGSDSHQARWGPPPAIYTAVTL